MNNIDIRTLGKMVVQAAVWGAATFLVTWQGDTTLLAALKVAGGVMGAWLIGNMQRTGGVVPTIEGLKK